MLVILEKALLLVLIIFILFYEKPMFKPKLLFNLKEH
jgi:hypothetical protein